MFSLILPTVPFFNANIGTRNKRIFFSVSFFFLLAFFPPLIYLFLYLFFLVLVTEQATFCPFLLTPLHTFEFLSTTHQSTSCAITCVKTKAVLNATILIRVIVTHWDSSNSELVYAHICMDVSQPKHHTDT